MRDNVSSESQALRIGTTQWRLDAHFRHSLNTMPSHRRIARPVSDLSRTSAVYCQGLGLSVIGDFVPVPQEWVRACQNMLCRLRASSIFQFIPARSRGAFEDPDGYRIVLQKAEWRDVPTS